MASKTGTTGNLITEFENSNHYKLFSVFKKSKKILHPSLPQFSNYDDSHFLSMSLCWFHPGWNEASNAMQEILTILQDGIKSINLNECQTFVSTTELLSATQWC